MADATGPLLEVRGLSVRFGRAPGFVHAVRDVSFALGREKLGIVGESGSGKSTLGRTMLGLQPASARVTAERLTFDGIDLLKASPRILRGLRGRRISMIMQDPKFSLNPVMRVGDQIDEGYRIHHDVSRREARRRSLEMLSAVRIEDPERVYMLYPHQISGGMGQRVMIAMMLIPEPDLIIADEPTSALDVTVRLQVLAILDDLVAQRGTAMIFISHDLNLVRSFCNRVLIMYAGRVVETLDAAALDRAQHPYTRGLLAAMPNLDTPGTRLQVLRRDPAWAMADDAEPGEPMPSISVDQLSLTFGRPPDAREVLDRVSFTVASGECFGLVGESGSGKSTILRCLAGLYEHWAGTLRIDGAVEDRRLARRRGHALEMVFQDPYGSLHPRHLVDTILRDPLEVRRLDRADQRIEKALAEVGLGESFRYRYPNELSGGQRQRVAIARALVLEPRILLLDEPTSALDVSVQAEILNLLSDIRQREGLTCILVSHDLAVVAHMCERLAVMRRGQIVETMTRDDLAAGRAQSAYARFLIDSSGPYSRARAAQVMPD